MFMKKWQDKCSERKFSLVSKGFKSLFIDGIRPTWDKVKLKVNTLRQMRKYYNQVFPSVEEREIQKNTKFEKNIVFSIIVPLYNTPKEFLEEMIVSVQNQTYCKWELCLADGSDEEYAYVEEVCNQYVKRDNRIKYKKLKYNMGISENTNAAIEMTSGNYIGLFDHDDLLHPSVLYEYMNAICQKDADFIYCDELTFERTLKNVVTMHFKPDYAIDNLRANNYICHFCVFDRKLFDEVEGFHKEFDGSQDHDMIFRLTEKARNIVHVPKILYFWRSHSNSVASAIYTKSYAIEAGKKAVAKHLERCGELGMVESSKISPVIYRIRYGISKLEKVSIIILSCNGVGKLRRCIDSIQRLTTYEDYEILVMESNSTEESIFRYYDEIKNNNKVKIIRWKQSYNIAAINNYAAAVAKGKYLLFLNNTTEVIEPEWIEELIMYAQRSNVGSVGAKLYYSDDTIQHAGFILGIGNDGIAGYGHRKLHKANLGYMGRLHYAQNVSAVTLNCMMVQRKVFFEVNGFEEDFTNEIYIGIDFCMKVLKAGYLNVFNPYAELYNHIAKPRRKKVRLENKECFKKEIIKFKEKWKKELSEVDPYYNPNLAFDKEDFSIRV